MKYLFTDFDSARIGKDKRAAVIEITGEKETETLRLSGGGKLIRIGIGKRDEMTRRKLLLLVRKITTLGKSAKAETLFLDCNDLSFSHLNIGDEELGSLVAQNMEMAVYEFTAYKHLPKEDRATLAAIAIKNASAAFKRGTAEGTTIGAAVNASRTLSNTPPSDMYPAAFAAAAVAAARRAGIRARVLGVPEMKKLKMGGVLAVGQGSARPPKFLVLEYFAGKKREQPIVLVGKGVTFDSGGIDLKPESGMNDMHMDMSGGAAVVQTLVAAARLKLKKNLVALVPMVENMPSGSSYRPHDVIRTMSGKTIEVLNTDAEGRVILADALTYAKRYQPRLVVDVATLTGAAMVALGLRASAVLSKDDIISRKFQDLGEKTGDHVWPLPLWEEYEEEIRGTVGDVANIAKTRYGGAITAAMFLYQFAKDYPWAHLDIAPRMTSVEGEYLAKGSAGAPVRLLVELCKTY